jgi:hypothetical protein
MGELGENKQIDTKRVITRRDILKGFAATTIASLLNLFPELGGVKNAAADTEQVFYDCYKNGTYYCCDITTHRGNCYVCDCCYITEYTVTCQAIFGCTSCANMCRGPYNTTCDFSCAAFPACFMCPP